MIKTFTLLLFSFATITLFGQTNHLGYQGVLSNSQNTAKSSLIPFAKASSYGFSRNIAELNSIGAEAYPTLSRDGLRLYYLYGDSTGSFTKLRVASRPHIDSLFGSPTDLLTQSQATSYWVSNDELDVYVTLSGSRIAKYSRSSVLSPFNSSSSITINNLPQNVFIASVSTRANRQVMYLFYVDFAQNTHIAKLTANATANTYTYSKDVYVTPNYSVGPGQLSKDGLSYYYTLNTSSFPKPQFFEASRNSLQDTFALTPSNPISDLHDTAYFHAMASFSDSAKSVVFTRASMNNFLANDLYTANENLITKVKTVEQANEKLIISPNPFINELKITGLNLNLNPRIILRDISGKSVYEGVNQSRLHLSELQKGIYFLQVVYPGKIYHQKIIKQ